MYGVAVDTSSGSALFRACEFRCDCQRIIVCLWEWRDNADQYAENPLAPVLEAKKGYRPLR